MALIICPECGKQISDRANACPQCGYPLNQEKNNETVEKEISGFILMAQRALDEKNYSDAERYYSKAYENDPNNWKFCFLRAYCKTMSLEKPSAVSDALLTALKMIDQIADENTKWNAYHEIYTYCNECYMTLAGLYQGPSPRYRLLFDVIREFVYNIKDNIPRDLPAETKKIVAELYDNYMDLVLLKARRFTASIRV